MPAKVHPARPVDAAGGSWACPYRVRPRS